MLSAGRVSVVQRAILPMEIYRFSAVSVKSPVAFSTELKEEI